MLRCFWLFFLALGSSVTSAQLEEYTHLSEAEKSKEAPHYRFPDFRKGTVERADGQTVEANLNYNLATEEVVVDLGQRKMPYPFSEDIVSIQIDDAKFISHEGIIFEIINEDKVSLLVHRQVKLQRLGQNTGLGRSGTISSRELPPNKEQLYELTLPGTFEARDLSGYFLWDSNQLFPIDKSKQVFEAFPKHKDEVKNFFKKEKIKMRKEEDLIRLVTYCNSLANN